MGATKYRGDPQLLNMSQALWLWAEAMAATNGSAKAVLQLL